MTREERCEYAFSLNPSVGIRTPEGVKIKNKIRKKNWGAVRSGLRPETAYSANRLAMFWFALLTLRPVSAVAVRLFCLTG